MPVDRYIMTVEPFLYLLIVTLVFTLFSYRLRRLVSVPNDSETKVYTDAYYA